MTFAFKVVSKRNARVQSADVFFGKFEGGYVGAMLNYAQEAARAKNGKLERSVNGYFVEINELNEQRALAETFRSGDHPEPNVWYNSNL